MVIQSHSEGLIGLEKNFFYVYYTLSGHTSFLIWPFDLLIRTTLLFLVKFCSVDSLVLYAQLHIYQIIMYIICFLMFLNLYLVSDSIEKAFISHQESELFSPKLDAMIFVIAGNLLCFVQWTPGVINHLCGLLLSFRRLVDLINCLIG